jgi:uncharacterized membrane protein YqjE
VEIRRRCVWYRTADQSVGQPSGLERQLEATGIETVQIRLSLISNEIEQEKLRVHEGLLLTILAALLFGIGLHMPCGLIIALFWDSYRLQVLAALSCTFRH